MKPGEAAQQLDVSPSTLRRWSAHFARFLGDHAGEALTSEGGGFGHRRYTPADVAVLRMVRDLLAEGRSYEQVDAHLASIAPAEMVVARPPASVAVALPAPQFLSETLQNVASGQQLLLNSQQANRDLLQVVLQDNFNLKDENTRLREQMMRLEQELSENRRREEAKREMLERRLERLEEAAYAPDEERPTRRRGWLARLLGLES